MLELHFSIHFVYQKCVITTLTFFACGVVVLIKYKLLYSPKDLIKPPTLKYILLEEISKAVHPT